MIECDFCNRENPDNAYYCGNCGNALFDINMAMIKHAQEECNPHLVSMLFSCVLHYSRYSKNAKYSFYLGYMYEYGIGTGMDLQKAKVSYEIAAVAGYGDAAERLRKQKFWYI